MATIKQIEANRRNASKSTGPRTDKGKLAIRRNALKHGLLSTQTVLPNEDQEAFEQLGRSIRACLQPVGEVENLLVDRIITSTWRLRRACRVEVEIFKFEKEDSDPTRSLIFFGGPTEGCDLGMAFIKQGTGGDAFSKLSRYEAAIERSLYKALHELQRLQAARNGGNVPLPLAVDADVTLFDASRA